MDRQRNKIAAGPAAQVSRLTHSIMNQLTVIYLSCAKLRRSLGAKPCANDDSDIQVIESAVAKVAAHVNALRFRLEKATPARPKTRSKEPHNRLRPSGKLSFISSPSTRDISKT